MLGPNCDLIQVIRRHQSLSLSDPHSSLLYSTMFSSVRSSISQCCLSMNVIAWKKAAVGAVEELQMGERESYSVPWISSFLSASQQTIFSTFENLSILSCYVQRLIIYLPGTAAVGNQIYNENNWNAIGASDMPGTVGKTSPALFLLRPYNNSRRCLLLLFPSKRWGNVFSLFF